MLKYERIITDEEQEILQHDLLDIKGWIDGMIEGKINNCAKRAAREYQGKSKELGLKQIPVDHRECASHLFKTGSYKNRVEREKEIHK